MVASVKAILTPAGGKAASTTISQPIPAVAVGDIVLIATVHDNTSSTAPTVTINKPAGETNNWASVSWTNPTATSGGGLHGRLYYIRASVAWPAASRTLTFSASITAKVSGGFVIEGGTLPLLDSGVASHASASVSLAPTSAPPAGSLTVWLAGREDPAIGTIGGPMASGTSDTGGGTSGSGSTTNVAARMRVTQGVNGTTTLDGAMDKGLAFITIPEYVSIPPGTVLNIGPGGSQNHFRSQYSANAGGVSTLSQAQLAAGSNGGLNLTVDETNTRVKFLTRADGAVLPGSSYGGSELVEVNADGSDMAFNALTGEHIMIGTTDITSFPLADPNVVIAQLHDGVSSRVEIFTEYDDLGDIYLACRVNGVQRNPNFEFPFSGSEFQWKIRVNNGTVEVFYNNMTTPVVTVASALTQPAIPDKWHFRTGLSNRFKVGEIGFLGGTPTSTDTAEATLKDLSVSHTHGAPTGGGTDTQKIAIGSTLLPMDKLYIGSTKINRVYVGDVMVYDDV